MAKQQQDSPRAEGRERQAAGARQAPEATRTAGREGAAAAGATGEGTAAGGSTAGAGMAARGDQERQREVTRERDAGTSAGTSASAATSGATSRGTGMQRGGTTRGAAQPALLPAFMANPGLMASAFMSNPFTFAQAMSEEMERLLSTFGTSEWESGATEASPGRGMGGALAARDAGRGMTRGAGALARWVPQMEVRRRGDALVVRADLPGIAPDDVHIEIEDGMLTIAGERRREEESEEEGWYRSERSYGAFSRSLPLPDGVDEERVEARFEHGVLEVTVPLPKQERPRTRRVQIQPGRSQPKARGRDEER